jgi:hypothetical protein
MRPMTDTEAIAYALSSLPPPDDDLDRFVAHALTAIADRASLVEASWSTSLPDGILLRIDAARRHMEGK